MGNYLPLTEAERAQMLERMGHSSIDELYAAVPTEARAGALSIPAGKSELEVKQAFQRMAAKNKPFTAIFRGAGAYNRYIPAVVDTVAANEKFLTAYTPYQAEISQGVLQSIFEYQTCVCELTGMDVSNASVYDGASAAAEAIIMCQERKRSRAVISATVHPHTLETVKTYCKARSIELDVVPAKDGVTDTQAVASVLGSDAACLLVQQPNFFGILEDVESLVAAAHEAGAKAIVAAEPISLGMLATPGELEADICVCEGQPLGMPLSFGGPYLGIMTAKQKLMRKLPGRIVGQTADEAGNRAFVLTLQAREQHIRREKASSNVCSNEALCALRAGAYLATMGPAGVRQAAEAGYAKAHYLAAELGKIPGFSLRYEAPFFNEFVTECPVDPAEIEAKLAEHGVLSGLPLEGGMLWCATEMNSKEQIDELVGLVREAVA